MKYEIEIDKDNCIACAACYTTDSVHFEGDSEGKSKVVGGKSNGRSTGHFNDSKITDAQAAEGSCPVSAIKVSAHRSLKQKTRGRPIS